MNNFPLPENAHVVPAGAEKVFSGVLFDVYQWQQEQFDGTYATFEMLKRPHSVSVIALDEDDKVIALDEVQPGAHPRTYRTPGGRVDRSDESALSAAQREMKEETGYEFAEWGLINVHQPHAKIEWFVYTFYAEGIVAQHETEHDRGEKIEIVHVPFDEFVANSSDLKYIDEIRKLRSLEEFTEYARHDKGSI